jgi:spore coat protein U-like protein
MRKQGMRKQGMSGTTRLVCGLALMAMTLSAPIRLTAATATSTLAVSATVISSCTVLPGTLSFGNYNPTNGTAQDVDGSFIVTCTTGTAPVVGLGLGNNAAGSTRRMVSGLQFLTYEIYKETGRTNVWGDAGAATVTLAAAPSILPQTIAVYGRIPANQSASTGVFLDTVAITLTF